MEIRKKNIHMSRQKAKGTLQVTLEDDFNVPDTKPDIEKIITSEGTIEITENNLLNGKCMVKGILSFGMIYISHEGEQVVHNIQGKIDFDEMVNLEHLQMDDQVKVSYRIEDLNISLINSRKISVKSLIYLECSVSELYDTEIATDIEEADSIACRYGNMPVTELAIDKKDILRIKESFHLSTGKPNIFEVLYYNLRLQGLEMRLQEDQISVRGELLLFVMYRSAEEREQLTCFEAEQPFHTSIACNGCTEDMILQVELGNVSRDLQIKPDEDGEERTIETELSCNLDVKVYKQEEIRYLEDAYSLGKDLQLDMNQVKYRNLVSKNAVQKRLTQQIPIDGTKHRILQICHSRGQIQIEEQEWKDDGIYIEGSVEASILYIGEDDQLPMGELKASIPFSHTIEMEGNPTNMEYLLLPQLEQMATMLLGRDSLEVKANLGIEVFVFENRENNMIQEAKIIDLPSGKLEEIPSLVGYQVQQGESLWDIAKQFHTTIEEIENLNQVEESKIKKGDKLLLLKKVGAN